MTKTYNVSPRHRHKRVANEISKQIMSTGKVNKKKALKDAGYPESTSKCPSQVFESKGLQKALLDAGLTDDNLAKWLYEDCVQKPGERVREINLIAKMRGLYSNKVDIDVSQNKTVNLLRQALDGELDEPDEELDEELEEEEKEINKEDNDKKGE